jgi:hypothetical protein
MIRYDWARWVHDTAGKRQARHPEVIKCSGEAIGLSDPNCFRWP